jgi:hypothetical protein
VRAALKRVEASQLTRMHVKEPDNSKRDNNKNGVFIKREIDRQAGRQTGRQADTETDRESDT